LTKYLTKLTINLVEKKFILAASFRDISSWPVGSIISGLMARQDIMIGAQGKTKLAFLP
jgi:hypothetical protein